MAGVAPVLGFALVAVVAMTGGPALAGENPCKGIDHHWRIAGHHRTATTSDCVGNPKTPLCAVDTYEAGQLREDLALEEKAAPDSLLDPVDEPKEFTNFVATYRVVKCRVMTEHDRPYDLWGLIRPNLALDRDHTWSPGDIGLDILDTMCKRTLRDCPKARKEVTLIRPIIVRKVDENHWRLVDWRVGDAIQIQGHVGPPCQPEDGNWQTVTGDAKTTTSRCQPSDTTSFCAYVTSVLAHMDDGHSGDYFRYKVLDCKTFGTEGQDPDHWDPRPFTSQPGHVRIGLLLQTCSERNQPPKSACGDIEEILLVRSKDGDRWVSYAGESRVYPGGAD